MVSAQGESFWTSDPAVGRLWRTSWWFKKMNDVERLESSSPVRYRLTHVGEVRSGNPSVPSESGVGFARPNVRRLISGMLGKNDTSEIVALRRVGNSAQPGSAAISRIARIYRGMNRSGKLTGVK